MNTSPPSQPPSEASGEPLRILLVEDVAADAELILRELRRVGVRCATQRVHSAADLRDALHRFAPDIVLADHALPQLNARDALHLVKRERPLIPVVIVTGSLDEETAADYIKEGAADYVVKHRLFRLGPAVQRALAMRQALEEASAAEAARSRAEQRFRKLVEYSSDVITLLDERGDILYSTQSLKPTLGYAAGELVGRSVFDVVHPDDRGATEQLFRELLAQADPHAVRGDLRVRHKNGTWRYLEVMAVDHRRDPAVRAVVVNYHDVTERKRAEDERRRLTEFLSHARAASGVGSWEWDIGSDAVMWSEETFRIFGVDPAEGPISYERYLELIHPEDRATVAGAVSLALERREPFALDHRIVRPDGTLHYLHGRGGIVTDAGGRPVRMLGVVLDITGRKQVEEALRRANDRLTGMQRLEQQFFQAQKMEAVGRLAGGVAHDFNNLLTVITSYSDLLLEELGAGDPKREDVTQIRKASESAAALTRQLLAFSRQQVLQPQVLDLNETVAATEKLLKRLIGEDVQLATTLAPDLSMAVVDPGQLEQIIMNLAVNARDAMPRGGRLAIETANVEMDEAYVQHHPTARAGRYVMLAVSDTGTGMDAQTQAHIFEPFFTTKEFGKGTGLGLATVYGIVKQSGGFIWVYSEPGHGTTFKIYFPWAGDLAERRAATEEAAGPPRGTETVLVAEDAASVRAVMRQVLERCGYTILEAPDGETALQLAAKHHGPIHLLLTDVVMPGVSGRQLADQLTQLRPEIKVLYASGYTDDAILQHGILEPGIAYLQKPFTRVALARKVREVLDGS